MGLVYLGSTLVLTGCMALLDRRFGLFFWADARRAAAVMTVGVVLFLAWDLIAIARGMYHRGASPAMTGLELAPELPLEELTFIVFLCYVTMIAHRGAQLLLARRAVRQ